MRSRHAYDPVTLAELTVADPNVGLAAAHVLARYELKGEELRQLRERAGLTQGHLAELVGCTQPAIANVERSYNGMDAQRAVAAAAILGQEAPDLVPNLPTVPGYPHAELELLRSQLGEQLAENATLKRKLARAEGKLRRLRPLQRLLVSLRKKGRRR